MEDDSKKVHFVNITKDSPMESGEIPPTQGENAEMKEGEVKVETQEAPK